MSSNSSITAAADISWGGARVISARSNGWRFKRFQYPEKLAESARRADISVFPIAFPFIAGPGALATILLWFGPVRLPAQSMLFLGLLLAVMLVLAIALLLMWAFSHFCLV